MSVWIEFDPQVPQPSVSLPVLAIGNLKGGVGKTTLVTNLAYALAHYHNLRVLLIDLDFQASLSDMLLPYAGRAERTGAISLLLGESSDVLFDNRVVSTGFNPLGNLSVVRSSFELADIEDRLFVQFVIEPRNKLDIRYALTHKLSDPRLPLSYDVVLLDTPPRLTTASINALCAATHVLIPTALTTVSISGAITFADVLRKVHGKVCPRLKSLAIVPCLTTQTNLTASEIAIISKIGEALPRIPVWKDENIPRRQAIADNRNFFQNETVSTPFKNLAAKIVTAMDLRHNERHAIIGANQGAGFGWNRLP